MSNLIVINHLTLDGVMQAPGRPNEDPRGGFEHGGWSVDRTDEVMGRAMGERMAQGGGLLLGRHTYEQMYAFWPKQGQNPYSEALEKAQKYVASRTLEEPLPWANSTLLEGDAADAVSRLKGETDGNLTVMGSGDLLQSLMRRGLVDEYMLLIHPLVLGSGRRLFPEGCTSADLGLIDTVATTTGVVIATYRPGAPA
jgi:dihydrofolate reductase